MPLDILDQASGRVKPITAPMYQAPLDQEPGTGDELEEEQEYDEDGIRSLSDEEEDLDSVSSGLGVNTLIGALNKLPSQPRDNVYDTVLCNVSTLVRNRTIKDKDPKQIERETEEDVYRLVDAIAKYHSTMGSLVYQPRAIFYLPDYSWLPEIHMRPLTGNRKIIHDVTEALIKKDNLRTRKRIRHHVDTTELLEVYVGGRVELPYKTLIREIRDLYKLGRFDPRSSFTHYLLISHMALDYHFMLHFPKTMILESFTSKFIPTSQLSLKVFGNPWIGFNSVTHLLLGDSQLVKPMAQRKSKARIIEMAKHQSWAYLKPLEIAKRLNDRNEVPLQVFLHTTL